MKPDRIKEIEGLIERLKNPMLTAEDFIPGDPNSGSYPEPVVDINDVRSAASALRELLEEKKWKPIKTLDDLPKKPGLASYEQIPCLIFYASEVMIRVWNCEHSVWDGEDGDDYYCGPLAPKAYMLLPSPPEEGEGR